VDVEHSTCKPKVEGYSPAAGTGREKMANTNTLAYFDEGKKSCVHGTKNFFFSLLDFMPEKEVKVSSIHVLDFGFL
jgi:hypothetical protein